MSSKNSDFKFSAKNEKKFDGSRLDPAKLSEDWKMDKINL